MLVLSCIALWWVRQAHQDAMILLFLPCSVFCRLKPVNETCYVYMVSIISSGPFGSWLVRYFCCMHLVDSWHALFCYVKFLYHVDFVLWTLLPDAVYAMSSNFTKSVNLICFALLSCLFEPVILWFSLSSVFIFRQASWVHQFHMLCCYVGVQ